MSAAATNDGLQVDALRAEYNVVKANLTDLGTFTGTVALDGGGTITTARLLQDAEMANTTLMTLYAAGNTSWEAIQTITAAIQIASGNLNDLTNRVNTAMLTITAAQDAMITANAVSYVNPLLYIGLNIVTEISQTTISNWFF